MAKIIIKDDEYFMRLALAQAKRAAALGETPVGAVIVCGGEVVSRGYNRRETAKTALGHAELTAISRACKKLGGWRLHQCTLYVSVEPCPMCAGACVNAHLGRIVYGAKNLRFGCFGTVCDFNEAPFNHKPEVLGGVLERECSELMSSFFRQLREKRK